MTIPSVTHFSDLILNSRFVVCLSLYQCFCGPSSRTRGSVVSSTFFPLTTPLFMYHFILDWALCDLMTRWFFHIPASTPMCMVPWDGLYTYWRLNGCLIASHSFQSPEVSFVVPADSCVSFGAAGVLLSIQDIEREDKLLPPDKATGDFLSLDLDGEVEKHFRNILSSGLIDIASSLPCSLFTIPEECSLHGLEFLVNDLITCRTILWGLSTIKEPSEGMIRKLRRQHWFRTSKLEEARFFEVKISTIPLLLGQGRSLQALKGICVIFGRLASAV